MNPIELAILDRLNRPGGGGSVPEVTQDDNGKVLKVVDGNWAAADGSSSGSYKDLQKVEDYLYDVYYNDIDYKNAYEYFETTEDPINTGACSSVRNGNFFGRNFDWVYDNSASFIVHVPKIGSRNASVGVSGHIDGMTDEFVSSGASSEKYKIVPFMLVDGINDHGVVMNTNVVPTDLGVNRVLPTGDSKVTLSAMMIVRYVLDHFNTASDAVNFIQQHMTIYFPKSLHDLHYELHAMIADKSNTYLVEFVDNAAVVTDMTENSNSVLAGKPYMTNFYLNGVTLNDDGTVYTPETMDETHSAGETNGITDNGSGLERYNYIVNNYATANTKDGMRSLMNGLKYTNAYSTSDTPSEPYWYTEFVGVNGLTVNSPADDYAEVVEAAGQMYLDRERGGEDVTWQSVHSAVYDINELKMYIIAQEDGNEFEYSLESIGGIPAPAGSGKALVSMDGKWTTQDVFEVSGGGSNVIEWDGDTTDHPSIIGIYYRVADAPGVTDPNMYLGGTFTLTMGGETVEFLIDTVEDGSQEMGLDPGTFLVLANASLGIGFGTYIFNQDISVPELGGDISSGVYFMYYPGTYLISKLVLPFGSAPSVQRVKPELVYPTSGNIGDSLVKTEDDIKWHTRYYHQVDEPTNSIDGDTWIVINPNYLYFEAVEDTSLALERSRPSYQGPKLQYSFDKKLWNNYEIGTHINLSAGEKIYWRGNNFNISSSIGIGYCRFTSSGLIKSGGNVNTLLSYQDTPEMTDNCFSYLFFGCNQLLTAPELPATELAKDCYRQMFSECTSLTEAPQLPATTLSNDCYYNMFYGCTSLVNAPQLPATTLSNDCYYNMFYGCTSLVNAPELPATTLANYCYAGMFYGCTSLVNAPELPATTLANYCYQEMFKVCTSLVNAPELPATELANHCYNGMFGDCTSLVNAPALPATTLADNCYYRMFNYCTSLVNVPELSATTLADNCCQQMFSSCTSLVNAPELPATTLAYNCYEQMFKGCTSLVNAPELPATTLADNCYLGMFRDCASLVNAPELPATTLANYCYYSMFYGCTALVNAPELPATTLANYCYYSVFRGCTSLVSAPELPATTLADYCYYFMFVDCTSLVNAPELPATTLANYCYFSMFSGCTALVNAPELPATTLADYCYQEMFSSCMSLTSINASFTSWADLNSTKYWLRNVSSTGTFTCPEALDTSTRDASHVPSGWTIVTIPGPGVE